MKEPKKIDLSGMVFSKLTVIEEAKKDRYGFHWKCRCVCGKEKVIRGTHLKQGKTVSCGCQRKISCWHPIKHGYARSHNPSPEYTTWLAMMARCNNPKTKMFRHYGGRGITVCDRWLTFDNFIADMGDRPSDEHSLDRFPDKNGNYEPGNCRWATKYEQARNKRNNVYLELNGVTKTQEEWAAELNADPGNMGKRLKSGQSFEQVYNHYKYFVIKRPGKVKA